jgi:hypothetical protein
MELRIKAPPSICHPEVQCAEGAERFFAALRMTMYAHRMTMYALRMTMYAHRMTMYAHRMTVYII